MPVNFDKLPAYEELPVKEGAPRNSAWGLFGDEDQVGCINLLTAERVMEAARLVRKGAVYPLNLRVDMPNPPLYGRGAVRHTVLGIGDGSVGRDDYLDNFYPQASSQWDGLRHIRHPRDGFYNGVKDEEIVAGDGGKLGMEHWARRGIVGRGVLLDVERYQRRQGSPIDPRKRVLIGKETLEATAKAERVEIRTGDILLIRTGWLGWYLNEATAEERRKVSQEAMGGGWETPGIGPAEEMAAYLWNAHVAALAADNPALEAWPPNQETGFLHFQLIPLLGIPIGELWYLEELAADCAQDGAYEFMLTSAPLHVPGGVGSPPNALAIK